MADDRIAGRINIKYSPDTGGMKEQRELPLKVLVLGDFSAGKPDKPFSERRPLDVNKFNFEDRLRAQNLSLDLSVPDKLSGEEGAMMKAELKFNSLKDFGPDAVVQQVDRLRQMLELRSILTQLKEQYMNEADFRAQLSAVIRDPELATAILNELKGRSGQGE
jgi:type VI secretion system protein ImpB